VQSLVGSLQSGEACATSIILSVCLGYHVQPTYFTQKEKRKKSTPTNDQWPRNENAHENTHRHRQHTNKTNKQKKEGKTKKSASHTHTHTHTQLCEKPTLWPWRCRGLNHHHHHQRRRRKKRKEGAIDNALERCPARLRFAPRRRALFFDDITNRKRQTASLRELWVVRTQTSNA